MDSARRLQTGGAVLRVGVCTLLTAAFLSYFSLPALAQQPSRAPSGGNLLQLPDSEKGLPMLVQADEMVYNNETGIVTAVGNVEIYYSDYALVADRVVYDRNKDTVTAFGNVRMTEPDGNIVYSSELTVTGDFREGLVRSISVLTPDNARIAAANAERLEGNVIIFNKAVYTACSVPVDQPQRAPLWQIKAVKVIHNQAEKQIEYTDARFEFFGMPIAYLPYFTHPDPTVKRKSGVLAPGFKSTTELGVSVQIPYFAALAPDYDITLAPRLTQKQGLLMEAEWRHRLLNGSYYIRPAGIRQADPGALAAPGNTDWRGSVETEGEFRINSQWVTGWDATVMSDDTFLRVYDIDDRTEIISQAYLVGQSERNYFDARAMYLKGVLQGDQKKETPLVHPVVDYNYLFADPIFGSELGFTSNVLSLSREDGADTSRLINDFYWRRTLTDPLGQRFTPFFSLRGDLYRVNDLDAATNSDSAYFARGMATAGLEYTYPFISVHEWGNQVLEPIAQVIVRNNEQDSDRVFNEDARSLVFDDTLLFERDKFSGFDRVEGGSRANVGLRYTLQTNDFGYGSLLFGQSYHLAGDNPFGADTGLENNRSDFVGAIYLEPSSFFTMSSRFRLDGDDLGLQRHELTGTLNYGFVSTALTYANLKAQPALGAPTDREEVLATASVSLSDQWRLSGGIRYDLEGNETVENSIGLTYLCDCATISVGYKQDYFNDRDDEPTRTITLRVDLRTLGGAGVSQGLSSGSEAGDTTIGE